MPALMEFHRKLAWQLINNIYIGEKEGGGAFIFRIHSLVDDCTKARIGGGFALQKPPVKNKAAALNAEKR